MSSHANFNCKRKKFEISTAEDLINISIGWNDKFPNDGEYILVNDIDMSSVLNFIPIANQKSESFIGIFDGQFHCIKNLKVDYIQKYTGLFGYLGNKVNSGIVKNLAVLNCDIRGNQNIGGIVGVNYGEISNCVVTGNISSNDEIGSHTIGGIVGKNKTTGYIKNCLVNASISGTYDIGGIAGIQEDGGYIEKCFATGDIISKDSNGMAGGIVGSFNAGGGISACVATQKSIQGRNYIGKIVGQFEDEDGKNIINNISWDRMNLIGNESIKRIIKFRDLNLEKLINKETYVELGWDFKKDWYWNEKGYPGIKGFEGYVIDFPEYNADSTVINFEPISYINFNDVFEIKSQILSNAYIHNVNLVCSATENFQDKVIIKMKKESNNYYKCRVSYDELLNINNEKIYYYIEVTGKDVKITKPYYNVEPFCLDMGISKVWGYPEQITLTLGKIQGSIGFNWLTRTEIDKTVIEYRIKNSDNWFRKTGTGYILKGNKYFCHKVLITELVPNSIYEYRVGDGEDFMSEIYEFRSPSEVSDEFSFIFVTDCQSVSEKDYQSFKLCLDVATKYTNANFIVNAGDITQNGYKSIEWKACFNVLGKYFAQYPTISIPGNHEMKGDKYFEQYKGRFFMPGGSAGTEFDDTLGSFEYGNAHIIALNTEIIANQRKYILNKQINWAKDVFKNSNKKWKIVILHDGLYMAHHNSDEIRGYLASEFDNMEIDLVLNGHDHTYVRSTMKNLKKVPLGQGTTYITGGTVGNKFYNYLNGKDSYIEVYQDKKGCQVFSIIKVSEYKISVRVYSKKQPNDWDGWNIIDSFDITKK